MTQLRNMLQDDGAATLVEYGLIVALIACAAIVAVTALGAAIRRLLSMNP